MSKSKVIISGVTWTIINNIASILYGIVSVPFLLNYFGKEEYGLIGIALSVNIYVHLLDMGMTNTNVRFFSEYLAKKENLQLQTLFSLTHFFYLIVGILNSIILFALSFWVNTLFDITKEQGVILRNLLWILALNATFSWISACYNQLIAANESIDWIKKRTTFLKVMQFITLLITIIFKLNIEYYFLLYIFIPTLILPLTLIKIRELHPFMKFNIYFDKCMFYNIYPYALSIFSFSIFQFLVFNSRPIMLGGMEGPSSVAEFNIMNTIATVVTLISGSFMQVLLPIVTKLRIHADKQGIMRLINDGMKYVTILLSGIIFLLIASMKEIVALYVGDSYLHLVPWIILWLLTLLLSHRNVMTSFVFTEKKIKSIAWMGAIAMIAAIICYIKFIPVYGVGGVVIGFIVHELIHTLFYYIYFMPHRLHIKTGTIFMKSVLPIWFLYGIGCLSIAYISLSIDSNLLTIIIEKTLFLGTYMIFITWLVVLDKEDRLFLKILIKK